MKNISKVHDKSLLIIGTMPPPIGGVTVHVKRLIEHLHTSNISFKFLDFKKESKVILFKHLAASDAIHLHTSNSFFRLLIIVMARVFGKKVIFTFHGNLGRHERWKNLVDKLSIRIASLPILINKTSYLIASKINSNSKLVSAFLSPKGMPDLPESVAQQIAALSASGKDVYCTNAFNVSFDKNNHEIYQISQLVSLFNTLSNKGLIISDPSGNYLKYLHNNGFKIASNILIIPFIHDFNQVLMQSDCFIRFTTTDGDSLSVKEALSLGKQVIATNVVDRPKQVTLVSNNVEDLKMKILDFDNEKKIEFSEDTFSELKKIYSKILQLNLP